MADTTGPAPANGITDEMLKAGAHAVTDARRNYETYNDYAIAERVLRAALAGRTVVVSPDPDGTDSEFVVTGLACSFGPRVNVRGGPILTPEVAEKLATALLDAAREARRLAAESSGDGAE